jgi:Helicase associated domain
MNGCRPWEGFEHLQAYVTEYGNCRVPQKYRSPDGYRLGGWVGEQRLKPDAISPECAARLNSLGFDWDPFKTDWEEGFEHLTAYVNEYKHCRVPHAFRLGGWVLKRRQKRDKLSTQQQSRLDALQFDWDPIATQWEEGYDHLKAYVIEHEHCRVPSGYKSPDGYLLGRWVGYNRRRRSSLSNEIIARLDALEFIWNT